jgi:hypothetical protein
MYEDLHKHLTGRIHHLSGPWVHLRSSYEQEACDALGFTCDETRYSDASWRGYSIELKKGKSVWIDLVRYSEVLVNHPEKATDRSVTIFMFPSTDRSRVSELVCVQTSKMIQFLNLDASAAKKLLWLHDRMPRQLNAQASLTIKDIRSIQAFSLKMA